MRRTICFSVLLLLGAFWVGCSVQEQCPGKAGCVCDDAAPCDNGLTCTSGTCRAVVQEPVLTDASGADEPSRCEAGTLACRCLISGACQAGLRCERGICQTCPEGTAGCACKNGKTCGSGLKCEAGICSGCQGKAGCACYTNGNCDTGAKCVVGAKGVALCEACGAKGDLHCNCEEDNHCSGTLICLNKRCQAPSALKDIPKVTKCYHPCQGNIRRSDGTIRQCHPATKLMEGCLPGSYCESGSCIPTSPQSNTQASGDSYPFCRKAADCPKWQTCISGRCYSECTSDSGCEKGESCHVFVCRKKCDLTKQECAADQACQKVGTGDDEGFCMPLAERRSSTTSRPQTDEVFSLTHLALDLNNHEPDGIIGITNKGRFQATFTISRTSDTTGANAPLSWLHIDACTRYNEGRTSCLAFAGAASAKEPFAIEIPAGQKVILKITNTGGTPQATKGYEGVMSVQTAQTKQPLHLRYRRTGTGRWKGTLYSFANFNDVLVDQIKDDNTNLLNVKNALLRIWSNYKRNNLSYEQFAAALRSIREGTWQYPQNKTKCQQLFSSVKSPDVVCYPSSDAKGFSVLSDSQREVPVPSGVSSLDFAIAVKEGANHTWEGRINSSDTLHFPGNPKLMIAFAEQPGKSAKSRLTALSAVSVLGGRYHVSKEGSCLNETGYTKASYPWLIPGFTLGSSAVSGSLFRERSGCRSTLRPVVVPNGATAAQQRAVMAVNASLSAANPVPNGQSMKRTLSLIDGALIDNRILFALVKESFTSPFSTATGAPQSLTGEWSRYGYIWLKYTEGEVTDADTTGSAPALCSASGDCAAGETCKGGLCQPGNMLRQVSCDPALVELATGVQLRNASDLEKWSSARLIDLVDTLLGNQKKSTRDDASLEVKRKVVNNIPEYGYANAAGQKHYIHYYCEDTQEFNGGSLENPRSCPAGSKVIYFSLPIPELQMRGETCQNKGSQTPSACGARLVQLRTLAGFRDNIPYRCEQNNGTLCDRQRKDMREGKIFYRPAVSSSQYVSPLQDLTQSMLDAFRYRIKFQGRTPGKSVGFTPSICDAATGAQEPYCFEPKVIEQLEERVNCLEAIYGKSQLSGKLDATSKANIRDFLKNAFSYSNENINGVLITKPGFETLNAELKVMLGDEAFTRALTSRYDLANSRLFSFEGDRFEPNGIKLSGVLGYELYSLYLSVQYYQSVLDRFSSQLDAFVTSFGQPGQAFLRAASVTSYFRKLLLAATRKARSWSYIARKYHRANRIDLARHVLERAYVQAYMEQLVMTRLLQNLTAVLDANQEPQLRKEIERITLTYNAALLSMQETYQKVSRQLDTFGFPDGYIPFPAVPRSITGAAATDPFRYVLQIAKQKLYIAQEKEDEALQRARQFDTDAARFRSELVKLDTNGNEQLIQICGQLKQGDQVVPATIKYAALYHKPGVDDPCGRVQGGSLYDAYLQLERVALASQQLQHQRESVDKKILAEKDRIKAFCDNKFRLGQVTWNYQDEVKTLTASRSTAQLLQQQAMRFGSGMMEIVQGWKCQVIFGAAFDSECLLTGVSNGIKLTTLIAEVATTGYLTVKMNNKKKELLGLQRDFAKTNVQSVCNVCPEDDPGCSKPGVARIESQTYLAQLALELESFQLRALQHQYDMRVALANIQGLQQRVRRLIQEQEESFAMLNEVNAAMNDPNQRIYKNDAVLNAERTFAAALQEAYRATLVYEYYTSQSYVRKGELFLIRMVGKGDRNLESYMSALERAFLDFEEKKGKPDTRVLVLSLVDDILKLPYVDEKTGKTLGLQERIDRLRVALNNPANYDKDGYLRINFSIAVDNKSPFVSPVTFNHKVAHIEVEIKATERGDDTGRVYIRQSGTGMIRKDEDTIKYYTLPTRTAVVNTYFNGHKAFDHAVYRNYKLQDRPLGNTQWALLFNQATELANKDIELNSINDIVIYIYYTDFSKP